MTTVKKKQIDLNLVTLRQIWDSVNVTTILLNGIYETHSLINSDKLNYPFIYLLYEYGLINIYLDRDKSHIHLLFNRKKMTKDKKLTTSSLVTVIDHIVTLPQFVFVESVNDTLCRVKLKIPKIYLKDVNLITESKYSQISKDLKTIVRINYTQVPITNNVIARYIVTNNLASMIVNKSTRLRDTLKVMLDSTIDNDGELFVAFSEKEYWNDRFIDEYINYLK